jgi:hypothetical protein
MIQAAPTQSSPQLASQPAQPPYARQPPPPTSAPRPPQQALSKLNTNEMQIQQPPMNPSASLHPLQAQSGQPEAHQQQSSPSIYFHHWVPPNSQGGPRADNPQTPSGKSEHESPFSRSAQSHLRSEYQSSPKKRKIQGSHSAPAAPTSQPSDSSPPFSSTPPGGRRRSGERPGGHHSRQRSDASSRGYDALARPSSRQRAGMEGGSVHGLPGGDRGNGRGVERDPTGQSETSTKQQTPATSSTSGDDPSIGRQSAQPETRQSRYSAGPEMKERLDTPKQEGEIY